MDEKISPAVELYCAALYCVNTQSTIQRAHAKWGIINYAIDYGVKFFADDFKARLPVPNEGTYTRACHGSRTYSVGNRSAAMAMENYWGRKPFLVREPGKQTPDRMYVGRDFIWFGGMQLTCTSFDDKKKTFRACQYADNRWRNGNPVKILKITHEDVKRWNDSQKNDLFAEKKQP